MAICRGRVGPEAVLGKLIPYLFFFAGILLAFMALPSVWTTFDVAMDVGEFESTEALVLSLREQEHRSGPKTQVVEFRYEVDGREYEGSNELTRLGDDPETVAQKVRRKDGLKKIRVWYDPQNPSRVVIHEEIDLLIPIGLTVLTFFCLLGGFHASWLDRKRSKLSRIPPPRRESLRGESRPPE